MLVTACSPGLSRVVGIPATGFGHAVLLQSRPYGAASLSSRQAQDSQETHDTALTPTASSTRHDLDTSTWPQLDDVVLAKVFAQRVSTMQKVPSAYQYSDLAFQFSRPVGVMHLDKPESIENKSSSTNVFKKGKLAAKDNVKSEIAKLHEGHKYPCQTPKNMKVLVPRGPGKSFADFFLAKLQSDVPFNFVRYGDGEWMCAMGQRFENCDLARTSTDMCQELARFTKDVELRAGVDMFFSEHICQGYQPSVANLSDNLGVWYPFFGFLAFLRDEENNRLPEMMSSTRTRGIVVLVGPAYLGRLHKVFGHHAHIRVPNRKFCNDSQDTWDVHQRLENQIIEESRKAGDKQAVTFLVAGGMGAKVLIMRMASQLGHKDSFLDIGSTFDVFAGVVTRPYQKTIKAIFSSAPVGDKRRIMLDWFNETDLDRVGC